MSGSSVVLRLHRKRAIFKGKTKEGSDTAIIALALLEYSRPRRKRKQQQQKNKNKKKKKKKKTTTTTTKKKKKKKKKKTQKKTNNNNNNKKKTETEHHWSCIAHLSAEDMLKSAVIEKKNLRILNLSDLDQGQWMTLTFGIHKALS